MTLEKEILELQNVLEEFEKSINNIVTKLLNIVKDEKCNIIIGTLYEIYNKIYLYARLDSLKYDPPRRIVLKILHPSYLRLKPLTINDVLSLYLDKYEQEVCKVDLFLGTYEHISSIVMRLYLARGGFTDFPIIPRTDIVQCINILLNLDTLLSIANDFVKMKLRCRLKEIENLINCIVSEIDSVLNRVKILNRIDALRQIVELLGKEDGQ